MTLAQQFQRTLAQRLQECFDMGPKNGLEIFNELKKQAITEGKLEKCGWFHASIIFSDGSVWGVSCTNDASYQTAFHW